MLIAIINTFFFNFSHKNRFVSTGSFTGTMISGERERESAIYREIMQTRRAAAGRLT